MGYKRITLEWKRSRLDKKKYHWRGDDIQQLQFTHCITNTCDAFMDCMPQIKRGSVVRSKPLLKNSNLKVCSIKGLRPPPPLGKGNCQSGWVCCPTDMHFPRPSPWKKILDSRMKWVQSNWQFLFLSVYMMYIYHSIYRK